MIYVLNMADLILADSIGTCDDIKMSIVRINKRDKLSGFYLKGLLWLIK